MSDRDTGYFRMLNMRRRLGFATITEPIRQIHGGDGGCSDAEMFSGLAAQVTGDLDLRTAWLWITA